MANLGQTFSADQLPQREAYDPLPAGWYSAIIGDAALVETKSGDGHYIKVRYDITGPTRAGRVVFGNLNIRNPNPKAEEIGRQQLGELIRAIGLAAISDTDQLINSVCEIKLNIRKDAQYGDQNDVKEWRARNGAMPGIPPQAAVPGADVPPWQR